MADKALYDAKESGNDCLKVFIQSASCGSLGTSTDLTRIGEP